MDDLSVEVRRTAGIYLKAKIVDVLQDFVVVELENNLHVRKEFPFNEVRFPPKLLPGKIEYAEGEQIEVSLVLESEESTECWVSGRVHLVKGEFVVAIFDVNGVKPQDIFPSDRVRRPNKNASITSESFHKHIIPIPNDLTSICQDVSNHKEFMQTCGASSVQYNPKLSAIVVLSCNEAVIKKAVLLTDMHLKSLRQKCALVQMMKDASKKLEQSTRHHHHPTAPYHDDFTVSKELMGLAIGSHGSNIQQAKQVPGIKGIELDENTGTFTIYGDSQKAVAAARSLLEFKKETINLPKNFISRVIGRNGHHIQDIVDRSGVLRVKIKNDEFPEEPQSSSINESSVPFIFVGTADSINNAKLLLNYQVNHLKEVEQLTIQKRQLDAQLRDLSISNTREQFPPRESESEREDTRGGKSRGQRGRPGYRGNRGQGRWLGNRQSLQNNEYQEGLGTRIATSDMDNRYGDQAQRGHYPDDRYQGDDMRGRGSARGRHVRPYAGGKHSLSPQQRPAYSDDVRKGGGGEGRDIPCKAEIERIAEQMANGQ